MAGLRLCVEPRIPHRLAHQRADSRRIATSSRAHQASLLHGGLEWRVGALRRYPSSNAHEFGLPELAHSVERFDRDGDLGRASGVVA